MKMNAYQAEALWARFATSEAFHDAQLTAGHNIDANNRTRFLVAWAAALADGNLDALLEELCTKEEGAAANASLAGVQFTDPDLGDPTQQRIDYQEGEYVPIALRPKVPGPTFPGPRHAKPKHWDRWPAAYRHRWVAEQATPRDWEEGLDVQQYMARVGLHPTKLYNFCGPSIYMTQAGAERAVPQGYVVRMGCRLRVKLANAHALRGWFQQQGWPTRPLTD